MAAEARVVSLAAAPVVMRAATPVAIQAAARVALPEAAPVVLPVAVQAAQPEVVRAAWRADVAALPEDAAAEAVAARSVASYGCRRPRGTVNPRSSSHFPSPKRRVPCAALPD